MKTCMFAVEGVLRTADTYVPLPDGTRLYHSMKKLYKLLLVTNSNSEEIERWLKVHGYKEHFNVYSASEPKPEIELRRDQVANIRKDGEHIDLVIDSNPIITSELYKDNITCLLYLSPKYSAPQFRPDYEGAVKPWDSIKEEMDQQYESRNRWQDAYNKELVE